MDTLDAFIHDLPKVELHLHLVGSAAVPTVLKLAARHPGTPVPRVEDELREFYTFRDFPHFAAVYGMVSSLVTEPDDIALLVLGAAEELARQNVRYVELTVTPYTFTRSGMPPATVTEALDTAARQADVKVAYIFDIASELGADAARATLDHALEHPPERLVGLGLGGIEQERAAHQEAFRDVFGAAPIPDDSIPMVWEKLLSKKLFPH